MLDIKRIRQNPQELRDALKARSEEAPIDQILSLDEQRRNLLALAEEKKALRNAAGKQIGLAKKNGAPAAEINRIMDEMRVIGEAIASLDANIDALDESLETALMAIPNYLHDSVPNMENIEMRRCGAARHFPWEPKPHWDIGIDLGILDWESAAGISGTNHTVYRGLGARLERAVVNFLLNTHCENGYDEIRPPLLVNRASMTGAAKLPECKRDSTPSDNDRFLIASAEVPVTTLYRDMILESSSLPIRHCAYSACFREKTESTGHDTRDLIHQHQFSSVELVKITSPEQSYMELENMTASVELALKLLGLPYRVVLLCSIDTGFSAAKTYNIEVWMPSFHRYVDISSCTNCEDFWARRVGIRYRRNPKDKPQYVHTLNGSGIDAGRMVAAILENYQNEDGTVTVPDVLIPYMGSDLIK